ncbi:MAG: hypothetical protein ACRDWI_19545, partial [Jiangellaceae bacterium]
YLATVIDCHTKAVVGWSMAKHMRTSLICDALTMAAGNVDVAMTRTRELPEAIPATTPAQPASTSA